MRHSNHFPAVSSTSYTTLKVSFLRETEKALRIKVEQPGHFLDEETFWCPKSQVKTIVRSHNSQPDSVEIPNWLIEKWADAVAGSGNNSIGDY